MRVPFAHRLAVLAATLVCAAVPVLRKRQPEAAWFRVPGGMFLPLLGVLICVALLTHADFSKSLILGATMAVAAGLLALP